MRGIGKIACGKVVSKYCGVFLTFVNIDFTFETR